jgi:membrane protein CcdC involved in cytochrome C biogenesis
MANDPIRFTLRTVPWVAAVAAAAVFFGFGLKDCEGFLIGAALSLLSLWVGKLAVQKTVHSKNTKVFTISALQGLLLLKLPLFVLVVLFVNSLGRGPLVSFLVGYPLVYLGLIVGAILDRSAPATCDEVP